MATGGFHLIYLEITNSKLVEVKHVELEHAISCLDINPIGENPQYSSLAAVGMWTDTSVRIFSLPGIELIRKENLGEVVPRSVLLCTIEEVCSSCCFSVKENWTIDSNIFLGLLFRCRTCSVLLEMVTSSVLC